MTEGIAEDIARIGSVSIDQLRASLVGALSKLALGGNVPAAGAVVKILADIEAAHAAGEHRRKVARLADRPLELCYYFGELGLLARDIKIHLGRGMSEAEKVEYEKGATSRRIEARGMELAAARGGRKPTVPEWAER